MKVTDFDVSDEKKIIETKCKRFNKVFDEGFMLYRGCSELRPFVGTIRKNRAPRDSTVLQAYVFDMVMAALGWPFLKKSNTLSTSISRSQAATYGDVHAIFPFDGTKYLYSIQHRDFITFPKMVIDVLDIKVGTSPELLTKILQNSLTWIQNEGGFKLTEDPEELHNAKGEILLHGANYFSTPIGVASNRSNRDESRFREF